MVYDLIILGSGAAGLTASIYASRYKLPHLVFGEKPGGQIAEAHVIENYPGFASISGTELTQKFFDHAQGYGVEIVPEGIGLIRPVEPSVSMFPAQTRQENGSPADSPTRRVGEVKPDGFFLGGAADAPLYEVMTKSGKKYQAKTLILAMGARHRTLNVPGEEKFLGRGVSYCATCDAPLFKGKTVAIVGGGDSALTAAVLLADYAAKVYLIHRGAEYRGEPVWVERMRSKGVVELMNNEVMRVVGRDEMTEDGGRRTETGEQKTNVVGGIELKNEWQGNKTLAVDGLFVEVGLLPAATLAGALGVKMAEGGYIEIDSSGRTNVPGVFGAGDLCRIPGQLALRQIVTSAAQGALAAAGAYEYLHKNGPAPSWG